MERGRKHILIGISGSIAAVKAPEIVRLLKDKGHAVRCVLTKAATQFVAPLSLAVFSQAPVIDDMFGDAGEHLAHITLAEEASLMLIAPATAATLARLATGLADDIVSCSYLNCGGPILIAPAMHTAMWEHPATQANVKILRDRGVHFIGPYQGPLADQSRGGGRMADPEEIVQAIDRLLDARGPH